MAEPLLAGLKRTDAADPDAVEQMISVPFCPNGTSKTQESVAYRRLLQSARELFLPENLQRIMPISVAPREATTPPSQAPGLQVDDLDPISGTARIAYDFLSRGGKYARPFITLAVYEALTRTRDTRQSNAVSKAATGMPCGTGCHATPATAGRPADASVGIRDWSVGVQRTAMSIEVFHKASLVHDDIEDDDDYRYGEWSLHKRYGIPIAINVGDYLVGMGYRLVSGCAAELGGDTVADLLDCLADAHQRLSEGQGAELLWRESGDKRLTVEQALRVYSLKTSPAFEVAFYSGLRLAGPVGAEAQLMRQFSSCLGVAFQILNDLQDWCETAANKGAAGGDVLGGRPTLLWALALERANDEQRQQLLDCMATATKTSDAEQDRQRLDRVRRLYLDLDVFRRAAAEVERLEREAGRLAEQLSPPGLRSLLGYLLATVLQRPTGLSEILVSPRGAA
jgi:geranylgeranyl pyrophosphate synthase